MRKRRFVLLDRDGTIIVECHYLSNPHQVELIKGAAEGLRRLSAMGFGLLVVTNQSGIGRGFFDRTDLELIHQRLCDILEEEHIHLDGFYFCPHKPEDDCSCRKPRTRLLELAAKEFDFEPQETFVIGDKACDIELGQRVKATTFLVRTGYGAQVSTETGVSPDYVVDGLPEAAEIIKHLLAGIKKGEV